MGKWDVHLEEARETLDELLSAVKQTQDWRARVGASHGLVPPTSYHRVLLWLWVHERRGGKPPSINRLAESVGISRGGMASIVKRMAYDCVLTITTEADEKVVTLTPDGALMAQA